MATSQNRKRQRADEDLRDDRRTKAQKTHPSLPDKRRAETPRRDQAAPHKSPAKSVNLPALDRPTVWHYPPEFWDRLSTIPLIRSALDELDRRNRAQSAFPPPPPSPTKLARDLARFARHGGPDLRDLRGYPVPIARQHESGGAMGSSPRSSSGATKSTDPTTVTKSVTTKSKKSSTHHRGFEQHLTDHGIHTTWDSEEPDLDTVHLILAKRRPSLSPSQFSDGVFKTFRKTNAQAKDEDDVMKDVIPTITGPREANYPCASSMAFGNLEPLTDGNIAAPRPDIALGALPQQLHPMIRDELQHYIIPSTATDRLLAPNFFVEAKGPDGSAAVMARQARYDGAVGVRAMHSLQNYSRAEPIYDGKAYTYTSTYHDGTLKMYAHHATAPAAERSRPEYHMTQINSYAMTGERQTFVQGATAFRNLRDLAKQHRETFIGDANARYQAGVAAAQESPTITAEAHSEHDSSSDEFVDCEAYSTPHDVSRVPDPDEQDSQGIHSQISDSIYAVTEPAASVTTSFTSSLPSGKSHNRGKAPSKRHRDSKSPPSGSRRKRIMVEVNKTNPWLEGGTVDLPSGVA